MALGTNHVALTEAATFIPEMWSDEVIAAYKSNLIVANHVTKINHQGKKGDTIHIPSPTRGSASSKSAETQVTLIANTEGEVSISIDQHYEYSRLIEDIVEVQALNSLRRFYTDDAGYALAKQIDTALMNQLEGLQGGTVGADNWTSAVIGSDGATAYDPTASTNTGNGAALADAGIRAMIQTLDDADVPMDGRVWIIPPVTKNTILGLDRFTRNDAVGEVGGSNPIRNGLVGDMYGSMVYVTSNCPTEVADDTSTNYRVGALLHKDALVFVEQMGVRTQTQYKQEWLGDLFTADTIYGKGELRNDAGIAFVVPA
jgi:HK97 family phage major capsid protein